MRRLAMVLLLALGLTATAAIAKPDPVIAEGNIAVGKFYTFSRDPIRWWSDEYPTEWSDGSQLTDERLGIEGDDWRIRERFVAWSGKEPVRIILDLGKPRPITQVRLHICVGGNTVGFYPQRLIVSTKETEDGDWEVYGRQRDFPGEPAKVHGEWLKVEGPETTGRYVQIRIDLQTPPSKHTARRSTIRTGSRSRTGSR